MSTGTTLRPLLFAVFATMIAIASAPPILAYGPRAVNSLPMGASTPAPALQVASAEEAIRDVIARSNAQQEQAISTRDPSVMRDTATDAYYQEMEEITLDLLASGVTGIELLQLDWGPIVVRGTTAEATTFETWAATTGNGRAVLPPERNVYRLVLEDGQWKIDANEHPDQQGPERST